MVSLARKNLFQDLPRFVVAQAGIMFAVSLVTIQTGLFSGFSRSTSLLVDNSKADIWVASEDLRFLDLTVPIPLQRRNQAQQVQGVDRAEALILRGTVWRRSSTPLTSVRVVGFDPEGQLFQPKKLDQGTLSQLKQPYTVMVDRSDLDSLNVNRVGQVAKVGSFQARIVGLSKEMRSIVSPAFMFTSLENAYAYINSPIAEPPRNPPAPKPLTSTDQVSYILIRAEPGQDLQALKRRIEAALPDTRAYTRGEFADLNQRYWQKSTGVGFILGLGAAVGMIVGLVIVGQILYASVSDHLKEFGTLKAMGSPNWFIYSVIIRQALWMAVLGYIPGMALCIALGTWTLQTQAIEILISPMLATGVFGLTIVMCIGAAVFAIQKVTYVDPAIVFKA
ncbi:ABC-type antimicrobial peptide transport system, permease component [uncultured Synechococcales cyanobacterium]|uniref:ABC-type antimicrobial peptide transport system, permease component n=1 Tax=uncultured Synechococcales cyanobacterium TaxID=1936017 RepID=A0A6J4VVK8_9CYAN|nr:ABC-type antimicrobial peptide transport system, permease component [uncultured Synechococcales cyanobacterium]